MRCSGILLQQISCETQGERKPDGVNDKDLSCRHRYPPIAYIQGHSVAARFARTAPAFILSGLYITHHFSLQVHDPGSSYAPREDDLPRYTS